MFCILTRWSVSKCWDGEEVVLSEDWPRPYRLTLPPTHTPFLLTLGLPVFFFFHPLSCSAYSTPPPQSCFCSVVFVPLLLCPLMCFQEGSHGRRHRPAYFTAATVPSCCFLLFVCFLFLWLLILSLQPSNVLRNIPSPSVQKRQQVFPCFYGRWSPLAPESRCPQLLSAPLHNLFPSILLHRENELSLKHDDSGVFFFAFVCSVVCDAQERIFTSVLTVFLNMQMISEDVILVGYMCNWKRVSHTQKT